MRYSEFEHGFYQTDMGLHADSTTDLQYVTEPLFKHQFSHFHNGPCNYHIVLKGIKRIMKSA